MKKLTLLATAMLFGALTATAQNTENGREYVDLGLPSGLKWATCNVGAYSPEEYGDYFAWGETAPKDNYSGDTYKWGTATYNAEYDRWECETLTKYNTNGTLGIVDNKTTLDPEDDAAAVNWGGKWRMPTDAEWEELITNCTWTWVEGYNGIENNGYEVTSKTNGNTIFLPAAGFCGYAGDNGGYWSSSLHTDHSDFALNMYFFSDGVGMASEYRYLGFSVRPVCEITTPTALAAAEMPAVYATDGRIVCAQEFRIFDLLGRDVTRQNGTLCGVYVVKTADSAQKVVVK